MHAHTHTLTHTHTHTHAHTHTHTPAPRSYVCDCNGWSFVKNSKRYYDDTAGILRRWGW